MDRSQTPKELLLQIVNEKHGQLPDIMREFDIDCWLVVIRETASNPDPVQSLVIGGDIVWTAVFIFSLNSEGLQKTAIVGNFDADAEKNKGIWDQVVDYKEGISDILQKTVSALNPAKIALNYSIDDVTSDGISHGLYLTLSTILTDFSDRFVSAEKIIQALRSQKSETEVELVRKAGELTDQINTTIQNQFRIGMTEQEIQKMFHAEMDNLGVIESWQRDSCPAVDAGPDKVMGHVGPSELQIQKGHTLHNDFGVQLEGYCSDIQRMWFFGTESEIPDELQHAFDTVRGAIVRASEFIKPGVKGWEVDKVARDHVISRGYTEYEHALGHQVGTKAHDGGVLLAPLWERYGDLPNGEINVNNVFTLELYVKTKNYGMVSLEEMIMVSDAGCKFLVEPQKKFITIN